MQKLIKIDKKYENFRWFFTSKDVLVVGGKSDEQNEIVLREFSKPEYSIVHTSAPGSPFMIIQSENPSKSDIEEGAIFCACFSKQWKLGKKLIDIDIFKGNQIYKLKGMKKGTFGVKGEKKQIKVKPELILVIQKGKFRAIPKIIKEKKIAEIKQGKLTKEKAAEMIVKIIKDKFHFPVSKEEIMSAIPSDSLEIK
jgi:predicted ribosome quality control (RQC) complex YloA/Tae2 family protein